MVMRVELAMDLMEGLYFRQLEKSTLMMSALALNHSEQVQESTSYTKLKTMDTDFVDDPQQDSFTSHKEKGRVKDESITVVRPMQCHEKKGDISRLVLKRRNMCNANTMTNIEAREEDVNDSEHRVRQTVDSFHQKPEVSNKTGTSPSGRDDRLLCCSYNKILWPERRTLRSLAPVFPA